MAVANKPTDFLFREMNVIVYMILAEAMIALTARAVAEFEVGIVGVGPAAYAAFVMVKACLLLFADARRLLTEVHDVRGRAVYIEHSEKIAPAEDEKV